MKTKLVVILLLVGVFLGREAQAFYNPNTGRWLNRDPIDEAGFELGFIKQSILPADDEQGIASEPTAAQPIQGNPYCFLSNEPVSAFDALGLWQLRCRPLAGVGGATGQRHCWIECSGHSYSLLNNNGTAVKIIDDPRDKGKGTVVEQGPGKCKCIAWQFKWNTDSFPYDKDQCNSNYFAHSILDCCGLSPARPSRAWGWDDCNDDTRRVQCVCYSGIVN